MTILAHYIGNSAPSAPSEDSLLGVITEIYAEVGRSRAKGYTPEHDDRHTLESFISAAAAYQSTALSFECEGDEAMALATDAEDLWPFEPEDFNPAEDPERNLVKAAGLIVCTILKLRRAREADAPAATDSAPLLPQNHGQELSHGQTPKDTDGEDGPKRPFVCAPSVFHPHSVS